MRGLGYLFKLAFPGRTGSHDTTSSKSPRSSPTQLQLPDQVSNSECLRLIGRATPLTSHRTRLIGQPQLCVSDVPSVTGAVVLPDPGPRPSGVFWLELIQTTLYPDSMSPTYCDHFSHHIITLSPEPPCHGMHLSSPFQQLLIIYLIHFAPPLQCLLQSDLHGCVTKVPSTYTQRVSCILTGTPFPL